MGWYFMVANTGLNHTENELHSLTAKENMVTNHFL